MLLLVSSFVFSLPAVDPREAQFFGILVSFITVGVILASMSQPILRAIKNAKAKSSTREQVEANTIRATTEMEIQVSPIKT
jgi:hypothetical protein